MMVIALLVFAAAVGLFAWAETDRDSRLREAEARLARQEGQAQSLRERVERLERRAEVRAEWPARPSRSAVYQVVAPRLPALPRAPGYDDGDDGEPTLDEAAGEVRS